MPLSSDRHSQLHKREVRITRQLLIVFQPFCWGKAVSSLSYQSGIQTRRQWHREVHSLLLNIKLISTTSLVSRMKDLYWSIWPWLNFACAYSWLDETHLTCCPVFQNCSKTQTLEESLDSLVVYFDY